MKNFKLFKLALITLLTVFATSCSNDDDSGSLDDDNGMPVITNEFVFNGTSYPLTKGAINTWGATSDGAFRFRIFLLSEGFNINEGNGAISGSGNYMTLDLNSDNPAALSDGTYSFSITEEAFTLTGSEILGDFDPEAGSIGVVGHAASGSVVLSVSDDVYDIEFNINTTNGANVTGNYTGSFTSFISNS